MSFLALPPEIRNQIYKFYYSSFSPADDLSINDIKLLFSHCTRLWCLSSQIFHESRSLFHIDHIPTLSFTLKTPKEFQNLISRIPKEHWVGIRGVYELESSDDTGHNYPTTSIINMIAKHTRYGTYREIEKAAGPETICGDWRIKLEGDGWKIDLFWSCEDNPYFWLRDSFNAEYNELLMISGDLGKLPFLQSLLYV
jgi:hypothetical protein